MLTFPFFVLKLFSSFDAWKQFFFYCICCGTLLSSGFTAILTSSLKRIQSTSFLPFPLYWRRIIQQASFCACLAHLHRDFLRIKVFLAKHWRFKLTSRPRRFIGTVGREFASSFCNRPVDSFILLGKVSVNYAALLETNRAFILEGVPERC